MGGLRRHGGLLLHEVHGGNLHLGGLLRQVWLRLGGLRLHDGPLFLHLEGLGLLPDRRWYLQ